LCDFAAGWVLRSNPWFVPTNPGSTPPAEKSAMRLIAIPGRCRKIIILGLALLLAGSIGRADGLPEWGMSAGAALFMIRVEAIKSPPLDDHVMLLGAPLQSPREGLRSSNWLEGYKVSLTNVTMVRWAKPVIEYIVYEMDAAGHIQRVRGTVQLKEIPVNGEITFITNQVVMSNALQGKLLGVRLRVYDNKNELLQDYAAPSVLMVWQKWEYPLSTEAHGLITPIIRGVRLNG
jgi:hypothetical protein